jgi:hypothetical protein
VISAVRKHGGVPTRKGAQEFWERVGKEVGMSSGATRMRFRRLPEDLQAELRAGYEGVEQD